MEKKNVKVITVITFFFYIFYLSLSFKLKADWTIVWELHEWRQMEHFMFISIFYMQTTRTWKHAIASHQKSGENESGGHVSITTDQSWSH